jgi:hypothetical protein
VLGVTFPVGVVPHARSATTEVPVARTEYDWIRRIMKGGDENRNGRRKKVKQKEETLHRADKFQTWGKKQPSQFGQKNLEFACFRKMLLLSVGAFCVTAAGQSADTNEKEPEGEQKSFGAGISRGDD